MDERGREPILPPPPPLWIAIRGVLVALAFRALRASIAALGTAVRGVRWVLGVGDRSSAPAEQQGAAALEAIVGAGRISSLLARLAADHAPAQGALEARAPDAGEGTEERPTKVDIKRGS